MIDLSNDASRRMPFRFEDKYHTNLFVDVCVTALAEANVAILDLLRS